MNARLMSAKSRCRESAMPRAVAWILWAALAGLPGALQAQDDSLERPPDIPPEGTPQSQPLSLPEDEVQEAAGGEPADGGIPTNEGEPPLPPKVQDEQLEPTVNIRDEEGRRIEEYSRGGQVYMVKVIPDKGVPYYYVDSDGDGRLETAPTKDLEQVRPVYWKVKEWD